jgi:membrane protease YdiL (CAAX protease family)
LDHEGRPRALLRLAFQYLVFWLATSTFATLVVGGWLAVRAGGDAPDLDPAALSGSPALPLVSSVAGLLGAVLSVWLAARFLDRRPVRDLGLGLDRAWWADLGFGLLLGAGLISALFGVELALGWVSVEGALATSGTRASFVPALLFPVATFLCVGFYEELIHRGYQIRNAAEGLSGLLGQRAAVLAAWALSSAFFGILHAQNPNATLLSTLNISLAGILLGCGYVLTGSLATPIGLHITWNFFQGAVYGLPVSGLGPFGATFLVSRQGGPDLWTGGSFGPEAGLLAPLAMILGTLLIFLRARRARTGVLGLHRTV